MCFPNHCITAVSIDYVSCFSQTICSLLQRCGDNGPVLRVLLAAAQDGSPHGEGPPGHDGVVGVRQHGQVEADPALLVPVADKEHVA